MEIYPHKVDWAAYKKACPIPEEWDGAAEWLHGVEPDDWEDCMSALNYGAEACDFMVKHMGRKLGEPMMNLLIGLGLDIEGWPGFGDDPHGDEINYHFGANLPPKTVKKLVDKFDAVDQKALFAALREHWPKLTALGKETWWAEDAKFWFPTAKDFLKYVKAWRDVYADAAKDGRGILTTAG